MQDLEAKLQEASHARVKLIATDGVFSMDGIMANLPAICDLADKYNALVMVDDSHAVGFMGAHGRGTPEYYNVMNRIDIITGTLGKALGGASGGYTSANKEIVTLLRQRSRPYLFSNTLAPTIAATSVKVIDMIESNQHLIKKVHSNSLYFRNGMTKLGFNLVPGTHPIIPVMLGDAKLASTLADELLKEHIYVIGFSYPVVPQGQARIRTQMSAGHEQIHLDKAIAAFEKVGKQLNLIK
jgi:glycine C-acetyltransferase